MPASTDPRNPSLDTDIIGGVMVEEEEPPDWDDDRFAKPHDTGVG
jgi:hypothetical protein